MQTAGPVQGGAPTAGLEALMRAGAGAPPRGPTLSEDKIFEKTKAVLDAANGDREVSLQKMAGMMAKHKLSHVDVKQALEAYHEDLVLAENPEKAQAVKDVLDKFSGLNVTEQQMDARVREAVKTKVGKTEKRNKMLKLAGKVAVIGLGALMVGIGIGLLCSPVAPAGLPFLLGGLGLVMFGAGTLAASAKGDATGAQQPWTGPPRTTPTRPEEEEVTHRPLPEIDGRLQTAKSELTQNKTALEQEQRAQQQRKETAERLQREFDALDRQVRQGGVPTQDQLSQLESKAAVLGQLRAEISAGDQEITGLENNVRELETKISTLETERRASADHFLRQARAESAKTPDEIFSTDDELSPDRLPEGPDRDEYRTVYDDTKARLQNAYDLKEGILDRQDLSTEDKDNAQRQYNEALSRDRSKLEEHFQRIQTSGTQSATTATTPTISERADKAEQDYFTLKRDSSVPDDQKADKLKAMAAEVRSLRTLERLSKMPGKSPEEYAQFMFNEMSQRNDQGTGNVKPEHVKEMMQIIDGHFGNVGINKFSARARFLEYVENPDRIPVSRATQALEVLQPSRKVQRLQEQKDAAKLIRANSAIQPLLDEIALSYPTLMTNVQRARLASDPQLQSLHHELVEKQNKLIDIRVTIGDKVYSGADLLGTAEDFQTKAPGAYNEVNNLVGSINRLREQITARENEIRSASQPQPATGTASGQPRPPDQSAPTGAAPTRPAAPTRALPDVPKKPPIISQLGAAIDARMPNISQRQPDDNSLWEDEPSPSNARATTGSATPSATANAGAAAEPTTTAASTSISPNLTKPMPKPPGQLSAGDTTTTTATEAATPSDSTAAATGSSVRPPKEKKPLPAIPGGTGAGDTTGAASANPPTGTTTG